MDNNKTTKYVIDANILINFGIFTPMENHIRFWAKMSQLIQQGRIILLKEVAEECKFGPLKSWVWKQKITPTVDILNRSIDINNEYHLITEEGGIRKSEADPLIIAYAEKEKCTVFSYESKRKSKDEPNKIPDVCKYLNVRCIKWPSKFFKEIKFGTIGKIEE